MNLTNEQREFLDSIIHNTSKNVVVTAFAGTGKTFSLLQMAKAIKEKKLYLAFNKAIELEAKEKFKGTNTDIYTTHGLAYLYIIKKMGFTLKMTYTPKEIMQLLNIKDYYVAKRVLEVVEDFCNSDKNRFEELDAYIKSKPFLQEKAKEFMNLMSTKKIGISFSAMLKLFQVFLLRGKIKLPSYRVTMLDEAQDTNDVTLSIFNNIDSVQRVYVGDPHQQIYSFRGGVNAMQKVDNPLNLALTNSFRYTKNIGDKATHFLSLFRDEQKRINGLAKNSLKIKTKAIIARGNLKLIEKIDSLLNEGKKFRSARGPASIFGLPYNLLKIRKHYEENKKNKLELDDEYLFLNYFINDYEKYLKSLNGTKAKEVLVYIRESIGDDNDEVAKSIKLIFQYGYRLNYMFGKLLEYEKSKEEINLYLTTAHTSKGLEWDSVELLSDFPAYKTIVNWFIDNDHPTFVKDPIGYFLENCREQRYIDELNLYYVAVTRAKYQLIDNTDFNELPMDRDGLNMIIKNKLASKKKKSTSEHF